ncbi:hypothetical protein HF329_21285 [Chitinophaga oryzae]|uniref:Uncharacterized protein n=1 Tax=Chitinophaga oryzae TaxID=2725414 RepID=A0AAE6ZBQ2_9BACT|nr:hypothetical protein [Chitinophaga oryzae]QJB29769.1 hypothetical protein HF329_21285 [Chitinophaga oryzae]
MKKLFLAVLALLATAFVYAQKVVLLTTGSRVPEGKKWVVPLKRSILVKMIPEAFQKGNMCSSGLLKDVPMIAGLSVGPTPYAPTDVYSIHCTGVKTAAATTPATLSVVPVYFLCNRIGHGIIRIDENVVIKEGMYVMPTVCMASIQVLEYDIAPAEMAARNAAAVAAAKAEAAAEKAEAAAKKAEEKKQEEAEAQRKQQEEDYFRERLDKGKPFGIDELDRPVRIVLKEDVDTVMAGRELARLLPSGKREFYSCRVEVDATGNIIDVESEDLNAEALRPLVTKYLKPARRGMVTHQHKQYEVPFYQYLTLQIITEKKEVSSYVLAGKKGIVFISPKTEQKDTTSPYVPFLRYYVNNLPEKEQKSLHRRLLHTVYVRQYISISNGKPSQLSGKFFEQVVPGIGAVEVDPNARLKNEVANKIVSGALILGSFL